MSGPTAGRPPFPVGWFVVARFDGLPDGALVPLAAFGQDLAVGRTPAGGALGAHATCPHLGADLAVGAASHAGGPGADPSPLPRLPP